MWGKNLGADNKVSYNQDQFINMRLFLMLNIRMMTNGVVVYVPTYNLVTQDRLLLICKKGHSWRKTSGGMICLLYGVQYPTTVYITLFYLYFMRMY